MLENHSCTDAPSVMDYEYEATFGASVETPSEYVVMPPEILNQATNPSTHYACTRYGMAHVINAQNAKYETLHEREVERVDPVKYWLEYLKLFPNDKNVGATLQSSLEQYRKDGKITGYVKCSTIDAMKSAILMNRLIFTGSQNGNWTQVGALHTYALRTDGRIVGHAFCIVGFSKDGWIAINSYGKENGQFLIPYELTDTLFTRYAVSDYKDEEAYNDYLKRTMEGINIEEAKRAFENKLWNGTRPTEPITREEAAAIIQRALDTIQK